MTDKERYMAAAHAMQSAVKFEIETGAASDATPKGLRVGVNSAMVETGTLVKILTDKGVFTIDEWWSALADMMENEVAMFEAAHPGIHFR